MGSECECVQTEKSIDLVREMESCLPSQQLTQIHIYIENVLRQRATFPPHSPLTLNTLCVCVCVCVCVCAKEREREREKLAGSIWRRFLVQSQINLILWHLITLPIIDNQNQLDWVTHIHICEHTHTLQ